MPLVPLGRILLTEPLPVVEGVFIPDLAHRRHELPSKDTPLEVYGPGAEVLAKELGRERYIRVIDEVASHNMPMSDRPHWRLWRADAWVETRQLPPCDILDYGCGSGRDAVALAATGHSVTAYDILPDALDRGRDLEARYGSGHPIEWALTEPDREFDLVLMLRCGRPELIEQAWARVKPGGRMWLTARTLVTPNAEVLSLVSEGEWTRAELLRPT